MSVMSYHLGVSAKVSNAMETRTAGRMARPPAVAGSFYPADPHRLRSDVARLLAAAPRVAPSGCPKAVIAPHAGYPYSGPVAAAAFVALEASVHTIRRVVLIGPAHYVPFRGIALPAVEAFETPLGRVPLDRNALAAIAELPGVRTADAPHAPEHALEVELPFLQVLLPRFTAVPLLVGEARPEEVAAVLDRLWGGPETVTVVSSDLSHFLDYETAQRRDAGTAAAIERGAWAGLGPGDACGYLSIAGLLINTARRGLKAQRLALCNSGDTSGERDRVVGYGVWLFEDAGLS
jgi:AmmeMemoRadiSam system protein B